MRHGYNLGHTFAMKTAISIRDEIFDAAERVATALGMSRSELYSKAVGEFVARHSGKDITARLNGVYGDDESASSLDEGLEALQFRSLNTNEEW